MRKGNTTMFCIKCGAKIVEGAKFCQKCGAPAAASGPPSADGAQVSPAGKPAGVPSAKQQAAEAAHVSPQEPNPTGPQEGRLRRRPLSSQVLHLPRGTREQVRPRRLASLAQTAKEPNRQPVLQPPGSRRTSLRWGLRQRIPLRHLPLAIRARLSSLPK